jgi:hypothetical protein
MISMLPLRTVTLLYLSEVVVNAAMPQLDICEALSGACDECEVLARVPCRADCHTLARRPERRAAEAAVCRAPPLHGAPRRRRRLWIDK